MKTLRTLVIAVAAWGVSATAYADNYIVGNNPNAPIMIVPVNSGPFGGNPAFSFSAGVTQNAAAGNLLKDFTNTSQGGGGSGSGIPSGVNVPIDETFTNTGTNAWTAWDEQSLTQTNFGGTNNGPDFLFDDSAGAITIKRNGTTLSSGTDYTLAGSQFNQFGNSGYQAITISFATSSAIAPGDTLEIQKWIHEVFSDGDVWNLNEAARVAEYPTAAAPEPASLALLALGAIALSGRRDSTRRLRRRNET